MRQRLSIGFMVLIISALIAIWWRWIYLPPSQLNFISVNIASTAQTHPLDQVLQKNLSTLQAQPALLKQFSRPQSTLKLAAISMDQCEVTQQAFRRFAHWRAARINPPETHPLQPLNWVFKSQTENHRMLGQLSMPVGGVSFYDAWAYCEAAGGRLPSSDEFEAISNGLDNRLYPWGNSPTHKAWPYRDPSLNIAQQCGSHPETSTPEQIHDLGNNVLEWTQDADQPTLMGGNAFHRPLSLNTLNLIRRPAPADFRSQYTGFRCVYNQRTGTKKNPWGSTISAIPIPSGTHFIGAPKESKIAQLIQHLSPNQLGNLKHLSIESKALNIKIMQHEVTRSSYQKFLIDPLVKLGIYNHPKQPSLMQHRPVQWLKQLADPKLPVTQVNWWSAWAFANWLGGRLPTIEEWEALAGANLTLFPYGNFYDEQKSIGRIHEQANAWNALPVEASYDDSKHKIKGLSGNVSEWTSSSVIRGNAFTLIIKGGSFYMPESGAEIAQTGEAPPNYYSDDLGFRVVLPN